MKQHIKLEQLNELSDKGIKKLAKWFGLEEFDATSINVWRKSQGDYGTGNLLLSIGVMIEFLDEHFSKTGHDFNIRIHSAGTGWKYPGQRLVDIDPIIEYELEDELELCDALWEACLALLNDEKKELGL